MIGTQEILIILAIALILFGGKKLPEIGKGLGKALREFKDTQKEIKDSMDITLKPSDTADRKDTSEKREGESVKDKDAKEESKDPDH